MLQQQLQNTEWISEISFNPEFVFIKKLRNLHNIYYYDLNSCQRDRIQPLCPTHTLTRAYILEYVPESYTCLHVDSPNEAGRTGVTCLDVSDDLEGGYAIQVSDKIPYVISIPKGHTLWYPQHQLHGVSKVTRGKRQVLISWWSDD